MKQSSEIEGTALIKWVSIFGVWMLVAVMLTSQFYSQAQLTRNPVPLQHAFILQAASACAWFILTPLVLWFGRYFALKRESLHKDLPIHLFIGAIVVLLQQAIDALTIPMLGYPTHAAHKTYWQMYGEFLLLNFHVNYLIYWMIVGVQNLFAFYRQYRDRELHAAQLEGQLAHARLEILKSQLHPHFLFNTLNTISELIYDDQEAAESMVANLSDLLRQSLAKMHVQEVSLRQELDFLKKYLEIEQMRFEERLQVKMSIAPETLDASVPNMILQPIVENSIRHGLAPLADGGTIVISTKRQRGKLRINVSDNGSGLKMKNPLEGIGLSNTRARLGQLYGKEQSFEIAEKDGWLQVTLQIPFKVVQSDYENKSFNSR